MKLKTLLPLLAGLALLVAASACGGDDSLPFGLVRENVAQGESVSSIAFAPDGRMFFAEQMTGAIRVISPEGEIQQAPFAQLEVATYLQLDWGLTGITLDPEFNSTGFVYAFYTEPAGEDLGRPKVVRWTDEDGRGANETVITDDFPVTHPERPGFNANGGIGFGPDGYLYLSVGDYDYGPHDGPNGVPPSQDLSLPIGKLLRIDPDTGEAAEDNPFVDDEEADPRVFAYGFREPFGFAFHPDTGEIYATDNTPYTCEQLNVIEPGADYKWPDVGEFPFDDCDAGEGVAPIYFFSRDNKEPSDFLSLTETSAVAFLRGDNYPQIGDSLLVCERGTVGAEDQWQALRRIVLADGGVTEDDILTRDCSRAMAVSPDGFIYYATESEIVRLTDEGRPVAPGR